MANATLGGHLYIIEWFISKGANDWNWGWTCATTMKNDDLENYFAQKTKDT